MREKFFKEKTVYSRDIEVITLVRSSGTTGPVGIHIIGKKFLQNLISSRDGAVKGTGTRQGWKQARRLHYYGNMAEKRQEHYPTSAA